MLRYVKETVAPLVDAAGQATQDSDQTITSLKQDTDMTQDELLRKVGDHEDNFVERKLESVSPSE